MYLSVCSEIFCAGRDDRFVERLTSQEGMITQGPADMQSARGCQPPHTLGCQRKKAADGGMPSAAML